VSLGPDEHEGAGERWSTFRQLVLVSDSSFRVGRPLLGRPFALTASLSECGQIRQSVAVLFNSRVIPLARFGNPRQVHIVPKVCHLYRASDGIRSGSPDECHVVLPVSLGDAIEGIEHGRRETR
jgi:hypothetical protein